MDPVGVLNAPPVAAAPPPVPQTPVAAPPASAAQAAVPPIVGAAPPPSIAALPPDTLIDIGNGVRMPARDVIAGYQAAVELGLNDNDNRTFLSTVYRATQGDETALQHLNSIRGNNPAAPATTPPSVPGTAPAPAPAAGTRVGASDLATTLQKMLEPVVTKVNSMYSVHEESMRTREIGSLKTFFQEKKTEFPNCAEIEGAATRVYERWDGLKKSNPRATAADLDRIMREEEAYLGAARPKAQPGQNTEVIRMDEPANRIPGLQVPGRAEQPPHHPASTTPTQMPVSTSMPSAGAPSGAPGQTTNNNQPMTMQSLTSEIERQVNAMGIRTR